MNNEVAMWKEQWHMHNHWFKQCIFDINRPKGKYYWSFQNVFTTIFANKQQMSDLQLWNFVIQYGGRNDLIFQVTFNTGIHAVNK